MQPSISFSPERIRELELPINRINYHLGNGVPELDLSVERIGGGVTDDELPALIEYAKERRRKSEIEYSAMVQRSALGFMATGAAILAVCWYLAGGDVPLLRQGRLLLGFVLGGGCLAYGLFRMVNRDPKWHF